jgi:hypothetical protein
MVQSMLKTNEFSKQRVVAGIGVPRLFLWNCVEFQFLP